MRFAWKPVMSGNACTQVVLNSSDSMKTKDFITAKLSQETNLHTHIFGMVL